MATVTTVESKHVEIDPEATWGAFKARPAVKAAFFPGGAQITANGSVVNIPGGFYAVALDDGSVRAIDAELFETLFASA